MRPLQQKLGWIQSSNSAEFYTVIIPRQTSRHFTAVLIKQLKIVHNNLRKKKNINHCVHIMAWKIDHKSLFMWFISLSFPALAGFFLCRFSFMRGETHQREPLSGWYWSIIHLGSLSVLRLVALQNYVWKKLTAETASLTMIAFPQSRSISS